MEPELKKIVIRSAIAHAVLLFTLFAVGLISSLFKEDRPEEIITFVDFGQIAEPTPEVLQVAAPEPPRPEPPKPEPPKPEPPKPEPVKKEPIKKSDKIVKRPDEPKPKPVPQPQTSQQKPLTPEEIRKLLSKGVQQTTPAPRGPVSSTAFAAYLALVRQTMYDAWAQPSELRDSGKRASVEIRIERDGRVTSRKLVGGSGNSAIDQSVMAAVNSVSRLKPLPPDYPDSYWNMVIEFELTGTSL